MSFEITLPTSVRCFRCSIMKTVSRLDYENAICRHIMTTDALRSNIRLTMIFPKKEIYTQLLHQTQPSWGEEEITVREAFWGT